MDKMAFIRNKEKNFKKYLENHFGLVLPGTVELFYAKGIRIGNKELRKSPIHGELGYAACDAGFNPTNALIQNFGHLARKNTVDVGEADAKKFAHGKPVSIDLKGKTRYVVVRYKEHILGLGQYSAEQRRILNKIPEKRSRDIINEI